MSPKEDDFVPANMNQEIIHLNLICPQKECIVQWNPSYGFYDIILPYLSFEVDSVTLAGQGQCPFTCPKIREPGSNFCFPILANI